LIAFSRASTGSQPHDIELLQVISDFGTGALVTEGQMFGGFPNSPFQLNTSDPGNNFDDTYPAWPPLTAFAVPSITFAYGSNRSVTYNDPTTGNPSEVLVNVAQGARFDPAHKLGASYEGVLESNTDEITPPTMLRFDGGEVVHVNMGSTTILPTTGDPTGSSVRNEITPGQNITFTVRLSDREAQIDDNRVYLQIKDPDSRYQDSNGREHKVLARDKANNDSGSATRILYNHGIGDETVLFTCNSLPDYQRQRGAVGGFDGAIPLTLGRDDIAKKFPNPNGLKGGDPSKFITWGQEYECQVVNPLFAATGNPDTSNSDYHTPYYLAGYDDQGIHSGPRGTERPNTEWLPLTRQPDDHLGGVLYSATWKTPVSPSDYYVDVIAYDQQDNWRIYDNVWGFSTQTFDGSKGILFVSDYTLGQKFVAGTFNGFGSNDLRPTFYGAEAMLTDYDVDQLPNAVCVWGVPVGVTLPCPEEYIQELEGMPFGLDSVNPVENALGVGSYTDGRINPTGLPAATSQQYSLWRILARGPIPQNVLMSFAPTFESQPAAGAIPADPHVPVATKCVIWSDPYAGDLFMGPGTLTDPVTQSEIKAFVAAGGRLCVTGQSIARTLTADGVVGNGPGGFLNDTLGVTWATTTTFHTPALSDGNPHRISYDSFFNANPGAFEDENYGDISWGPPIKIIYRPPSKDTVYLSNDANVFNTPPPNSFERTEAAETMVGFQTSPPRGYGDAAVLTEIDVVNPAGTDKTYHTDFTFPAGGALTYHEDLKTGSRVVFASFGLEGLGLEYRKTISAGLVGTGQPNPVFYKPDDVRPDIMHNIVSYLRTGSFAGTVKDVSGGGAGVVVPGVSVILQPNGAPGDSDPIPPGEPVRGAYTGITGADGAYRIDGVDPGWYSVRVIKNGYTPGQSVDAFGVEGDTSATVDMTITPVPAGSIAGTGRQLPRQYGRDRERVGHVHVGEHRREVLDHNGHKGQLRDPERAGRGRPGPAVHRCRGEAGGQ
jgi:hypothetical protein